MSKTKEVMNIGFQFVVVTGPTPSDAELELLRYVKLQEGGFGTVTEVNKKTKVGRRQTQNRLEQLVENKLLNVRLVGRTKVYWLTDKGETYLSDGSD